MNATTTNVVGRGSRTAQDGSEEIAFDATARLVRPLVSPSRSQRVASIETSAWHIMNHGSARFSARKYSEVSRDTDPANPGNHAGASPYQICL